MCVCVCVCVYEYVYVSVCAWSLPLSQLSMHTVGAYSYIWDTSMLISLQFTEHVELLVLSPFHFNQMTLRWWLSKASKVKAMLTSLQLANQDHRDFPRPSIVDVWECQRQQRSALSPIIHSHWSESALFWQVIKAGMRNGNKTRNGTKWNETGKGSTQTFALS